MMDALVLEKKCPVVKVGVGGGEMWWMWSPRSILRLAVKRSQSGAALGCALNSWSVRHEL